MSFLNTKKIMEHTQTERERERRQRERIERMKEREMIKGRKNERTKEIIYCKCVCTIMKPNKK